jgi:putative flippase GtrA
VGAANFVLTFVIFTTLMRVHAHYIAALVAASLVGMLFSYVLNFLWVFKPEETLQFGRRLVRFILSGLLSITLNVALLSLIVEGLHLDAFYTQFALIPLIVAFNFSMAKYWSLRQH